jgi:Uma2 family endonuclease
MRNYAEIPEHHVSVDEYLAFEEASPVRHEYVDGRIYAFAGGTSRHNLIALNIASQLRSVTRQGPCRTYISDMRLRVTQRIYYYPDVMVVCDPIGDEATWETSPCLIVEVLSESTATVDRREKLLVYRNIPTLETYLIVYQDRRRVEAHWRNGDTEWEHADYDQEGVIQLSCPVLMLRLDDVYEGLSRASSPAG